MSGISKIMIFLSSYSPLYFMIITLNFSFADIKDTIIMYRTTLVITKDGIVLFSLLLLIIIPILFLLFFIKNSKSYSETLIVNNLNNSNDKILDYILAYIVSFISTDFANIKTANENQIVTAIIMQILLGYLYCKGNMFYINPFLNIVLRYDIFIVENESNKIIILSKNRKEIANIQKQLLSNKDASVEIRLVPFSKNIYIYN